MLERIYDLKEINTAIASVKKAVPLLHTRNIHFIFDDCDCVYLQNDGVVMRSPLGLVSAGITIVELVAKVVSTIIIF